MTLNKGDIIKIDFTGKVADSGMVFDTTDEKIAKDNGLFDEKSSFEPRTICVGQGQLLKGLDEVLTKHDVGETFSQKVTPEDGFGKKSARLIQLISTSKFKKQGINPVPGLQVNIDNNMGLIKSVSGGRTLVDFNHPLAGKDLLYDITVLEKIDDPVEQARELMPTVTGMKPTKVEEKDGKIVISLSQAVPEQIQKVFMERLSEMIKGKTIEFLIGKD